MASGADSRRHTAVRGLPMRLLITRPEPDALSLKAAFEEQGHEPVVAPLLSVSFVAGDALELAGVQALIATSRNALRALKSHPVLGTARRLPLFAVGRATAAEARSLGFAVVMTGAGTAQELVTHIVAVCDPAAGLLLQLAGDAQAVDLAGELEAQGFRVVRHIVYRVRAAQALSADVVEQLATGNIDGVILMSPRTAAIYAQLMRKHGLASAARALVHFCVSHAAAARLADLGAVRIEVAERPRLEEVLALIDAAAAKSAPGAG
jgi:uroporphyrinogen-III synthase